MKINISKKQYQALVKCIETAGSIYGVMGDMVDEKHKKFSGEIDELSDYILSFAKDFGMEDIVEVSRGKRFVNEDYTDKLMDDIGEYEEYAFWDMLVRELARRELAKTIPEEEAGKLGEEKMIRKLWELEEKYRRWTEDTGLDGLEVKDKKTAE